MEEIFRQMKAICPRCKSWEYCRFRFLNKKRRCKKLQPRYICVRCNKYFTLGGKLYNTSSLSPSKARISRNRCPSNFAVVPSLYMSSANQYDVGNSSNGLHTQPSNCCWMLRKDMAGTRFCGSNLCCLSFGNPCSNTNSESNECQGMWSAHDGGRSSNIYDRTCFRPYDSQSGAELVPFTFLENFSEEVMVPNPGFSHCVNDIPPLNIVEPMEPLEVSQEMDSEYGLLMSEYIAEKAVNGTVVASGKQQQEEHNAEGSSTNLLGGEDLVLHSEMDSIFPARSNDLGEENEWLMDLFAKDGGESSENSADSTGCGSELENEWLMDVFSKDGEISTGRSSELENSDRCLRLELFDSDFPDIPTNAGFDDHHLDCFEGEWKVDDIMDLLMF